MSSYVAFAGNIAAGKSECAKILAAATSTPLLQEAVYTNPFLERFYSSPEQWAFQLQMFNLANRSSAILEALDRGPVVLDRSFEEDILFVDLAYERGFIDSDEYSIYSQLYASLLRALPRPTMLVYLRAPSTDVLLARIVARGRKMEGSIDRTYLEDLQQRYDSWVELYAGPKTILTSTESPERLVETLKLT